MQHHPNISASFSALFLALLIAFLVNLSIGSVSIPLKEIFSVFIGNGASKETWQYILIDYRLPKAITAMLAGGGLAISGLLMQTLFQKSIGRPIRAGFE